MNLNAIADTLGPRFEAVAADGLLALHALHLPAAATILDVGTGSGNFAIFLATQGHQVVTGEPATDTTQYSRRDWAQSADKAGVLDQIRFESFDAGNLPFENESFDAVCFFGVLHHIDESARAQAFREAARVSRQAGAIVFFEPRENMLAKVRLDDPSHPPAADPTLYQPSGQRLPLKIEGAWMDIYIYA
ncbi:MAG: class I SAM-dependent methyltransferase [Chloroflexia bacterium]